MVMMTAQEQTVNGHTVVTGWAEDAGYFGRIDDLSVAKSFMLTQAELDQWVAEELDKAARIERKAKQYRADFLEAMDRWVANRARLEQATTGRDVALALMDIDWAEQDMGVAACHLRNLYTYPRAYGVI